MIRFEDIDERLTALGKNRPWLAEVTPYSADYIRTVLAPKSTRRTERVQRVLSDAIEREEAAQNAEKISPHPTLPDRITIECTPRERRAWQRRALSENEELDEWVIEKLNQAADTQFGLVAEPHAKYPNSTKPNESNEQ